MPTGTGKTSVIDIALFHLALDASQESERTAPMRIAYVVDRRLVVDDAFDHAYDIYNKLRNPESSKMQEIADSLKKISFSDNPILVTKLRGGMVQESDWYKTPSQPLVLVSTIDQVGSRLLFRGYGVSDSMKPIHAGLLGTDILYIIDEAHMSKPFLDTLKSIQNIKQENKWVGRLPFQSIYMSATFEEQNNVFPPDDRRNQLLANDERLKERLSAHKYVELKKTKDEYGQISEIVKSAYNLAKHDSVKSIGIVVNRVDIARKVFDIIKGELGNRLETEVHLLTGRSRPFERDTFVKQKITQIKKNDYKNVKQMFFVATQCIEVGVDLSFDALVTQIAPVDSLRQRFGRLNRYGKLKSGSDAVIVAREEEIKKNADDIVYKNALAQTWTYLKQMSKSNNDKKIDFGINYFPSNMEKQNNMLAPRAKSITLLKPYLHFWMQTNPHPDPDPDPALFLHGLESKSADVQVIWRADITEDMLMSDKSELHTSMFIIAPSQIEAISLPIWTVKKWLSEQSESSLIADIEGIQESNYVTESENNRRQRKVIRWRGKKSNETCKISVKEIIPGDTIIVPSTYGGCDKYGWNANSKNPVHDIGMEANLVHRRYLTMRFDKNVVIQASNQNTWQTVERLTKKYADLSDTVGFIDEMKKIDEFPPLWKNMLDEIKKNHNKVNLISEEVQGEVRIIGLSYKKKIEDKTLQKIFEGHIIVKNFEVANYQPVTDEENVQHTYGKISLKSHCEGVKEHVKKFGSGVGLDASILEDIESAAFLHDAGKAEKRIQAFLRRKDPDEMIKYEDELIAKSAYDIKSKKEYDKYLKLAHLPKGYRHECWSVNLAINRLDNMKVHDSDLVLYLIGTHHGYGRPFFPQVNDDSVEPTLFTFDDTSAKSDFNITRIDSGWIERYEQLYHRYGPWNLAYMESLLRLADHRQSEKEANV